MYIFDGGIRKFNLRICELRIKSINRCKKCEFTNSIRNSLNLRVCEFANPPTQMYMYAAVCLSTPILLYR